jgi:hypothetical protein
MEEKRAHQRHDAQVAVTFAPFNQGRFSRGRLCNYGEGGVCLKADDPIKAGTAICLKLDCGSDGLPQGSGGPGLRCVSLAEIKWCRSCGDPGACEYEIGAKYL